jgi:hypothetical protein
MYVRYIFTSKDGLSTKEVVGGLVGWLVGCVIRRQIENTEREHAMLEAGTIGLVNDNRRFSARRSELWSVRLGDSGIDCSVIMNCKSPIKSTSVI